MWKQKTSDFFASIFTLEPGDGTKTSCAASQIRSELLNIEISKEDVLKKLHKLDSNKSAEPDAVHARVLKKKNFNKLSEPLFKVSRGKTEWLGIWYRKQAIKMVSYWNHYFLRKIVSYNF